jgi:hypothetical protein
MLGKRNRQCAVAHRETLEDELTVLIAALTTLLHKLVDRAIEEQSGARREEVKASLTGC